MIIYAIFRFLALSDSKISSYSAGVPVLGIWRITARSTEEMLESRRFQKASSEQIFSFTALPWFTYVYNICLQHMFTHVYYKASVIIWVRFNVLTTGHQRAWKSHPKCSSNDLGADVPWRAARDAAAEGDAYLGLGHPGHDRARQGTKYSL